MNVIGVVKALKRVGHVVGEVTVRFWSLAINSFLIIRLFLILYCTANQEKQLEIIIQAWPGCLTAQLIRLRISQIIPSSPSEFPCSFARAQGH